MRPAEQLARAVLEDGESPKRVLGKLPRVNYLPVGWELSRGTLDTDDLIDAGLGLLKELDPGAASEYQANYDEAKAQDWDLVEVETDLYSYIQRKYCPPFTFLGSHPGSTADIGVWPWEDMDLEGAEAEGKLSIVSGDPNEPPNFDGIQTRYVLVRNDDNDKALWDVQNRSLVWSY